MSQMQCSEYFVREHVITGFSAIGRDDLLRTAVDRLVEVDSINEKSARTVCKGLLEREMVGSTGIGAGIAIPHLKTKVVDQPVVAFFKPSSPVEFGATDGAPVHSLFMVISPVKEVETHVAILRWIAVIARSSMYASILRNTEDADSIYELFQEIDGAA